jgi:hypothetical protein
MICPGDILCNPVEGEIFTFLQTPASSNGKVLQLSVSLAPGSEYPLVFVGMGILALLAQASACAFSDGKRPLPAVRLTSLPITRLNCHAGPSLRKPPSHGCWFLTLSRWSKRVSLSAGSGRFPSG